MVLRHRKPVSGVVVNGVLVGRSMTEMDDGVDTMMIMIAGYKRSMLGSTTCWQTLPL